MVINQFGRDRSTSLPYVRTSLSNSRRSSDNSVSSWKCKYIFSTKEIGRGHFAKVYQVQNKEDPSESYALKIIRRKRGGSDKLETIRKEVEFMRKLWNQGVRSVVQLHDVHESILEVGLLLELAVGGSLYSVVVSQNRGLPENYVISIIKKLLNALIVLHSSDIVHLDIKADNILLRNPYPSEDVALCDFGCAVQLSENSIHRELVGTPDYIAPEIVNYDEITTNTDMWSVGVLTYFLLTGTSPFIGEDKDSTMNNVSRINYVIPENLSEDSKLFIYSLLVKKPKSRMSSQESISHNWLVDSANSIIPDSDNCSSNSSSNCSRQSNYNPSEFDSGYETVVV